METRDLIRKMSIANPLWGAPRIHGELLKLGIVVSQATVGRYMPSRPAVPSPTWRSFLHNHVGDTVAIDMFVFASATFRLLSTVIVLGHDRRRIIHFDVTRNPTQVWLARQMTEAFPWDRAPRYLLRDRDASHGQAFRDRIQVMGIKEVVTAARSPWQNAYVERIIGSVAASASITSSSSVSVTCAACCRPTFSITTKRERISRSTRIVRRAPIHPLSAGKIIAFPPVGGLHHRYERREA
jgi:putative transposase